MYAPDKSTFKVHFQMVFLWFWFPSHPGYLLLTVSKRIVKPINSQQKAFIVYYVFYTITDETIKIEIGILANRKCHKLRQNHPCQS